MSKASVPVFAVLLILFPALTAAQAPAPAGGARSIDAYSGYQAPQAAPAPAVAPAPPKAADREDGLDGKVGLGAFLKISDGLAGRTGIALRYWPHRVVGIEADLGLSLWSGERDGVAQQRQEFAPRLGLLFPVAHGKFTHFFLEVGGGPLLAKEPKEDLGLGLAVDGGFGVEVLLMRDPHLSLEFKGGGEYYSYRAAGLGNGAGTTFATGFTYYF